jgi:SAM-dependent methyltransferase
MLRADRFHAQRHARPHAMLCGMERDAADRERLAATFDSAAALYERVRPEYPPALYEHLLEVTGLQAPAPLLEVGCATGKATLPLARLGFRITALEPGAALAEAARANLAGYEVDVVEARFEDWEPNDSVFDLVYAATAWHWVDPEV